MAGRVCVLGPVLLLTLLMLSSAFAEEPVPVKFISEKPAYARVALTADGSKVLLLAFDESKGTGEGYDTLYADTNFNDVIEASEKLERTGPGEYDPFKPLSFDFGVNDAAKGLKEPLTLTLSRSYVGAGFAVTLRAKLAQDGQGWEYTFRKPLALSTDLEKTAVQAAQPLTVKLALRPGAGLGIAAGLDAGEFDFSCYSTQGSPRVRLLVLNADNETVSDATMPLDRLGFG